MEPACTDTAGTEKEDKEVAEYGIDRGTPNWDEPLNADLNDIDGRLTSSESLITGVQGGLATTNSNVAALSTQVSTNTGDIATNSSNVSTLQGQMSTVQGQVATNTSNISTNTSNISTNTSNITTLQSQVASNTSQIAGKIGIDTLVVNVKDHGAVGDGVNDDATGIANAISTLSSGGILYFPPGQYLVNSGTGFNISQAITIQGAGPGASSIRIGSSYTGTSLFSGTVDDIQFWNIEIRGNSSTTTSNPASHGITVTGGQTFKVLNCEFRFINGYAIRAIGTASNTLHGGQLDNIKVQSCAGGIHIKSDTTNTAANFQMTNIFTRFLGVNSGTNANLDGIRIEDSWDVLCQNVIAWMQQTLGGTGAAFRVRGDCAATFVQNLDALGPQTGNNVVIEGNGTTSPQNVQIQGGVIQQGSTGLIIADATNQVRVRNIRVINNQTHGVTVSSTGFGIYIDQCLFSLNGQGATGSNYEINWSGTATGLVTDCRFGTAITSIGVAGVQASINVTAGQNVRILDADFTGTGAASTNWVTAFPQIFSHVDSTAYEFYGSVNFSNQGAGRVSLQPSTTTNSVMACNTNGTDAFDRFRLLGNGDQQYGIGSSARDTTTGRVGVAQWGSSDSDIVANLAGKTFKVKSGTNAKAGTVTANGTTAVTVSTTAITANSVVVFGLKTQSGTAATAAPFMSAVTAGTSFQIKSSAGDTSVYNWVILDLI